MGRAAQAAWTHGARSWRYDRCQAARGRDRDWSRLREIVREVNDAGIKVNYDAGNVMDYLDVDPIPDLRTCFEEVRSFCIKDHRNTPRDEDCGPGFGEIDHYKLLGIVAFTGRTIPLCCENIFAPLLPRPGSPAEIDNLARIAREYLELVIRGLHSMQPS